MKQVVKRIAKWGCLVLLFVLGALSIFFVLFFYSLATPQYVCLDDGKSGMEKNNVAGMIV